MMNSITSQRTNHRKVNLQLFFFNRWVLEIVAHHFERLIAILLILWARLHYHIGILSHSFNITCPESPSPPCHGGEATTQAGSCSSVFNQNLNSFASNLKLCPGNNFCKSVHFVLLALFCKDVFVLKALLRFLHICFFIINFVKNQCSEE